MSQHLDRLSRAAVAAQQDVDRAAADLDRLRKLRDAARLELASALDRESAK